VEGIPAFFIAQHSLVEEAAAADAAAVLHLEQEDNL